MTFQELLQEATRYLQKQGVADAAVDAWQLMEYVFEMNRSCYFVHASDIIAEEKKSRYVQLLKRRGEHIPLQQLTNRAYFYGLTFYVNEHVLIPRMDTETLIEEARKRIKPGDCILDMCTGSGCILLTLLHECDGIRGIGTDLSAEALAVAQRNARELNIPADLIKSDLFENVTGMFDVIVSNPPYIPSAVIPTLMPEVKDHEPRMALDGEADGLYYYREIINQADAHLTEKGWIVFEIGHDQGDKLYEMLRQAGYEEISIIKDLAGLDRVAAGRRP